MFYSILMTDYQTYLNEIGEVSDEKYKTSQTRMGKNKGGIVGAE